MASLRFDGVRFRAYPNDHEPRHAHGFDPEIEVIVDLQADETVALAGRTDCVRPSDEARRMCAMIEMAQAF